MDPRRKPDPQPEDATGGPSSTPTGTQVPALEEQDWAAVESGALTPDSAPENGDLRYDAERDGDLPEEDDDNAYQNSDEALPDDGEERAISRDASREGGRFDEV